MSDLIQLVEKPPRSSAIVSAISEPLTRTTRRKIYMMAVWSVGCGEIMFAVFRLCALWPEYEALLTGCLFAVLFALLMLPSGVTALRNVRAITRLVRKGTLFMESIDAVEYKYPRALPLETIRVRFRPDGIERVGKFQIGPVVWDPAVRPVPVLFEPSNPGVAALLLPDGTAVVGSVVVRGVEPE